MTAGHVVDRFNDDLLTDLRRIFCFGASLLGRRAVMNIDGDLLFIKSDDVRFSLGGVSLVICHYDE